MRICLFLFIAGFIDAVHTNLGIAFGVIREGNPLMQAEIEKGWVIFYIIKILLPVTLLGLFWLNPFKGRVKTLLVSACVIYSSVLCYHLFWILLYFHHLPSWTENGDYASISGT